MIHNSRNKFISVNQAEVIRISLLERFKIQKKPIVKSSKILLCIILSSYLKYRKCNISEDIYSFISKYFEVNFDKRFINYLEEIDFDFDSTGYVVDYIFQYLLENISNHKGSNNKRKTSGAFYTPFDIADFIVRETIKIPEKEEIEILDPACGSGVFLSAASFFLYEKNFSIDKILKILHGWDINDDAIKVSKIILAGEMGLNEKKLMSLINSENFITKDTLLDLNNKKEAGNKKKKKATIKFIITNPPYDRLKPDRLSQSSKIEMLKYIDKILLSESYLLSSRGSLELYRLFIERIIKIMSKANSLAGLIIPLSFTNDKSAELLRKYLVDEKKIRKIIFIPEKNKIFEKVTQAFCILIIDNFNKNTFKSSTYSSETKLNKLKYRSHNYKNVISAFPDKFNLVDISQRSYDIITHLNTFPNVGELKAIHNHRGEFDLTFNRDLLFSGEKRLLRGKNITEFRINEYENVKFDTFIKRIKSDEKLDHINSYRIACQQISNMDSPKRLKFTLINPKTILGNSLNYMLISSGSKLELLGLLIIMNSYLMDWRFRLTSSNNHVNNYEIDSLPMPGDIGILSKLGAYLNNNFSKVFDEEFRFFLEMKVLEIFEVEEFIKILEEEPNSSNYYSKYNEL